MPELNALNFGDLNRYWEEMARRYYNQPQEPWAQFLQGQANVQQADANNPIRGDDIKYYKCPITGRWTCDEQKPITPPEFEGWERIDDPKKMRNGDVYVCYDPYDLNGMMRAKTPSMAIKNLTLKVRLDCGDPTPNRGWAVYRRIGGKIRLLPNPYFSKQLPLP